MRFGLWLMSFFIGILVGLTSMGGAALMTPFLILILGVRPVLAVGTDLVYGALTKLTGAWMHWRQGSVNLKIVRQLALGSIPGGILGVSAISYIHHLGIPVDDYVKRAIGVVLVTASTLMLVRTLIPRVFLPLPIEWLLRHVKGATIVWGGMVGFAVGLTSVGSGSLIAPFLMLMYSEKVSRVVGTDVFHAAILVIVTAVFYVGRGQVEWPLVPMLLAGSVPGVMVGSYLAPRVPTRALRLSLGFLLFATGIKML